MTDNNPYAEYDNRMVSEETNEAMWDTLTVQTAEQPKTTPIMNNNNQPTHEQTATEKLTNLIIELACSRGSRIVSTLEKINDYVETGLNRKADHAYYNLARNISKRLCENPTDTVVERVCNTLELSSSVIIDAVNNLKQSAKPRTAGGIVYDACVQYAVSTVRGDILRSNRVASSLEGCALRLCASRGIDGTIVMSEALDKALSKVYASIRSQAKTNGVEIGGKSNTATKNAAKTAILTELLRLKVEDSYQFDVIIGEVRPLSGQ
ncbi:MAG: hypothetical protein WC936_05985 [Candidatus Nanoarchaeia archaeon]